MLEAKARTKWCPLTFVPGPGKSAINHPESGSAYPQTCKGSDCMLWRWMVHLGSHGYCGLAGKDKHSD